MGPGDHRRTGYDDRGPVAPRRRPRGRGCRERKAPGRREKGEAKPVEQALPPDKVLSRYYGRVQLNPQRANKDMGLIIEKVVDRLSHMDCPSYVSHRKDLS